MNMFCLKYMVRTICCLYSDFNMNVYGTFLPGLLKLSTLDGENGTSISQYFKYFPEYKMHIHNL